MLANSKMEEAGDFPASSIAAALPLYCNIAHDVLYANIQATIDRGHEILYPQQPHGNAALLVGGGPSARHDVDEIRKRQSEGAHIFALNGAGLWLQGLGITPDAVIVLDARAHNARFISGLESSVVLLLASQCDPAIFEAGKWHRIIAWHPSMNGHSGVIEKRPTVLIGGSTTVGMRALRIVHVLGFREVHLFGYDSSYDANRGHAYPQPENDADGLRECEVAGRKFYAPAWMIRQADDFQLIAQGLMAEGMALHVHGDGLLPTIARQIVIDTADGPMPIDHERDKYRAMWGVDAYRKFSPGELYLDRALAGLQAPAGARFIDFGCGTGRAAKLLMDRGHLVMGVDIANNCLDAGINLPLYIGDLAQMPHLSTDYGICCDVMEHIPTDRVHDVLFEIADCVEAATFFSISLVPDNFGRVIGEPLHLTVRSAAWWLQRLQLIWPDVVTEESDGNLLAWCRHAT